MDMVKLVATRGTCRRRRVAAIITDLAGHILSTGYNGAPSGMPHCIDHPCPGAEDKPGDTSKCLAVHAEQNALLQCHDMFRAGTMYCTTFPCLMCARMILNTPIERLVIGEMYSDPAGFNLLMRSSRAVIKWNYETKQPELFSF